MPPKRYTSMYIILRNILMGEVSILIKRTELESKSGIPWFKSQKLRKNERNKNFSASQVTAYVE